MNTTSAIYEHQRIEYIDILRGLCMILIVWYHTDHPDILNYTFYNATLFFVSGMLFKPSDWGEFLNKKTQRYLIPFFFFYFVYYIFLIILNYLKYHVISTDIYLSIFDVFRWYKDYDAYTCNYPLWFIWGLFWVQVQMNFLIPIVKKAYYLFSISLAISLIGTIYIQHIPTPLMIGRSTTFFVYYVAGYLLSHCLIRNSHNWFVLFASTLIWLLLMIISCNLILSITKTLLGIFMLIAISVIFLQICKIIQLNSIREALSFWGVNSLILFGMHDMYLTIFRILTLNTIGEMSIMLGCLNWILTLLLMIPSIYFLNYYFPSLVGKKQ